jgi:hypothetical protein
MVVRPRGAGKAARAAAAAKEAATVAAVEKQTATAAKEAAIVAAVEKQTATAAKEAAIVAAVEKQTAAAAKEAVTVATAEKQSVAAKEAATAATAVGSMERIAADGDASAPRAARIARDPSVGGGEVPVLRANDPAATGADPEVDDTKAGRVTANRVTTARVKTGLDRAKDREVATGGADGDAPSRPPDLGANRAAIAAKVRTEQKRIPAARAVAKKVGALTLTLKRVEKTTPGKAGDGGAGDAAVGAPGSAGNAKIGIGGRATENSARGNRTGRNLGRIERENGIWHPQKKLSLQAMRQAIRRRTSSARLTRTAGFSVRRSSTQTVMT